MRRRVDRCWICGYAASSLSHECPECGASESLRDFDPLRMLRLRAPLLRVAPIVVGVVGLLAIIFVRSFSFEDSRAIPAYRPLAHLAIFQYIYFGCAGVVVRTELGRESAGGDLSRQIISNRMGEVTASIVCQAMAAGCLILGLWSSVFALFDIVSLATCSVGCLLMIRPHWRAASRSELPVVVLAVLGIGVLTIIGHRVMGFENRELIGPVVLGSLIYPAVWLDLLCIKKPRSLGTS